MKWNCDLGESEAMVKNGEQRAFLGLVEMANVCCGAHAGSLELTELTMRQVAEAGVKAGAHPGYPDREHFGRRLLYGTRFGAGEIVELVAEQVAAAQEAARKAGLELYHVKPHGALYNEAARLEAVAEAIAEGVGRVARYVFLVGLSGTVMVNVFRRQGFVVLREAFADRRYTADGQLAPRMEPGALILDPLVAAAQLRRMRGSYETVCVHSDSPGALPLLEALRGLEGED
ncbi:MAG: LamB/YcsF family protein [Acidobacteriota bacterium]